MKNTLHIALGFFLLFLLSPSSSYGQKLEKRISENYSIKPSDVLQVDSKFGSVNILNHDREQISIEAVLWVSSESEDLAEELLQELRVETSRESNRVVVRSVTPDKMPSRKNTKFAIDFTIYTPANINLELDNSYGAVYVEEIAGKADIKVSYGNLKVMELTRGNQKPLNKVSMAYSNGSVEEAGWLKTDLSFSKLRIEEAEAVLSVSSYSGMNINECSSLVSDSKYDTYNIRELKNYVGELKFGNLNIDELMNKIDVTSSFSTVKIREVGSDFEEIRIDNSRGSVKMNIDDNASFSLTGEAKRGDISVSGMDNLNKRMEAADRYLDGTHGKNPNAKIEINVTEGSVNIMLE